MKRDILVKTHVCSIADGEGSTYFYATGPPDGA